MLFNLKIVDGRHVEDLFFLLKNSKVSFLLGFQRRVLFLLADMRKEILSLKRERTVARGADGADEGSFQADNLEDYREMEERIKVPEERQKMVNTKIYLTFAFQINNIYI